MRKSGILMHLSSLPSPHGIGTMGQEAKKFVDFLEESGQTCWQLLPICPTSYGDSPYQSYSTFAGNPYFIDLDELKKMGVLEAEDYEEIDWGSTPDRVNYGVLYNKRYPVLKKAAINFLKNPTEEYEIFCKENSDWLDDFALFMALKDAHAGKSWGDWEDKYRNREVEALEEATTLYKETILCWKVYQFFFYKQWNELKAYANKKGIEMIGDLPIYVSLDSVDVWAHPELFQLNENKEPIDVAGCPPDAFSADGQLWGNPLYNWEHMEETGYEWWINRIIYNCNVYDILRIDHFRGFEAYYAIPAKDKTAVNGVWRKGPAMKLFRTLEEKAGRKNIIAEDLGFLTESVKEMLKESKFPGMKIVEFAFDLSKPGENDYLVHNHIPNCVAYLGTHDNNTFMGWYEEISEKERAYVKEYLRLGDVDVYWDAISALWQGNAETVIIQAQDLLGLGKEARMNMPSSLGGNWEWRAEPGVFTHKLAYQLKWKTRIYGRLRTKADVKKETVKKEEE